MALVVTQVGLDKATQAAEQGVNIKITHVAVGLAGYTPDSSMTALQDELVRVAISGGKDLGENQIHLTAMFDSEGEINGREIGFYLEDGTLFAIESHLTEIILYKSASQGSRALEGFDLVLNSVPPNSITVDTTGDVVINFDNEFKSVANQFAALQFAPYDATRVYKTGEVCTIEIEGEVIQMQMYAGPNMTCVNKHPADLANRHDEWNDATTPFWWIPYTGTEVGTPFWWLDTTPPESAVMELNVNLPTAVYWRLARRYPLLVSVVEDIEIINTGEIRGEFLRVLDQGRGIDIDREIGSLQEDTIQNITANLRGISCGRNQGSTGVGGAFYVNGNSGQGRGTGDATAINAYFDASRMVRTSDENRSRNAARAMAITI